MTIKGCNLLYNDVVLCLENYKYYCKGVELFVTKRSKAKEK